MNQNRIFEHITRNVLRRLTLNEEDSRVTKIKREVIRTSFIRNGFEEEDIDVDKLYYNLRHGFGLMDNKDVPLIRFIAPIAYSDEVLFGIDNSKREEQNKLKEIARFLKVNNDVFNEIKSKVSSFKGLCKEVEPYLQQKDKQEEDELANVDFVGGIEYDILEDVDYETANYYGKHSCSQGEICYTKSKSMWDGFKDYGKNKCYLLLSKDWKSVEEEHTEPIYDFLPYDGYDEYGLSMIFVFVDPNNKIAWCNTRWNHHGSYAKNGCDHALSKADLFQITGKKFSGYTEEDGVFVVTFENVQGLLDKGHEPEEVFADVFGFRDGFAQVELSQQYNYIDTGHKLLSKRWFDKAHSFKNGLAKIQLNNKGWNYINKKVEYLSDLWFDKLYDFEEGFAGAYSKNKGWNFIDTEGHLLSEEWFDEIRSFRDGFAQVTSDGKFNYINKKGKTTIAKWVENMPIFEEGFAKVELDGKCNFINTECELISDQWFDMVYRFNEGIALVKLNNKGFNYISAEGELISDQWFENARYFRNGFADVLLNGEWYKIDREGNII